MTVSVWQQADEPLEAEHDDVVIGAGIVGSYAATLLVQRGRNVALVDARFPAAGALRPQRRLRAHGAAGDLPRPHRADRARRGPRDPPHGA